MVDVMAALRAAIEGRLCVQTWLGVGDVLFVGFGGEVLPPTPPGERHPVPEYELQTGFANWWVETGEGVVGTSTGGRESAEAGAALLVGRRAIGWRFVDSSPALEITFQGDVKLRMAPYWDADVSDKDAWILRVPVYYFFMKWDGSSGTGRRDAYFTDQSASSSR